LFGIAKLNVPKSDIPAVTHVDYSARIQTVSEAEHPVFYRLLAAFNERTGCPVLVNTSFNVRGEPIVCSPEAAYVCFMRTEMDCLVINNRVFLKEEQIKWEEKEDWQHRFELD
jgi:carbamoyltransferase